MSISSKELATKIGVSPATVSLALNGKPGLSDKTRECVLEAAHKFGLKHTKRKPEESAAISLVYYKKHGQVLGDTAFFIALIEGVTARARKSGYSITISYIYTDYLEENLQTLHASQSIGIILIGTEMLESDIRHFSDFRRPIVVLDSHFETVANNCVTINNQQGAYLATRCLLDHGHRRIGHLASSVIINNFIERARGFNKACSEVTDCTPIRVPVYSTQEGAYADMVAYLSEKPDLPTAFFADNDLIAISCIRALKDFHYHIPRDVSIIGFDDMPMALVTSPKLTTVQVNKEELGKRAVDLLMDMISEPEQPSIVIMLNTHLVERDSVATINIANDSTNGKHR